MAEVVQIPEVQLMFGRKFRIIVDGDDRTTEYRARCAVLLSAIGNAVGWAKENFALGVRNQEERASKRRSNRVLRAAARRSRM